MQSHHQAEAFLAASPVRKHSRRGKQAKAAAHPARIAGKKEKPEAATPMAGRPATRYPEVNPPICHPCRLSKAAPPEPRRVQPNREATVN